MQLLLTENKCAMITREEKKSKLYQCAADKKYLFIEEEIKVKKQKLNEKVLGTPKIQ